MTKKGPRPLSQEIVDGFIDDHNSGMILDHVAAKRGHCVTTVCKYLHKAGVDTGWRRLYRKTFALEQDIISAYKDGRTAREIAETLGLCEDTVGRVLKENGVPKRGGGRRGKWEGKSCKLALQEEKIPLSAYQIVSDFIHLAGRHGSLARVAEKHGVSRQYVHQCVTKYLCWGG